MARLGEAGTDRAGSGRSLATQWSGLGGETPESLFGFASSFVLDIRGAFRSRHQEPPFMLKRLPRDQGQKERYQA